MADTTTATAPETTPATQAQTPGSGGEFTFTRAELDALIAKEKAIAERKATKGMPSDEELTAFRAWKDSRQTEQQRWDALKSERDTAKTELTAAQAKIEQYEREKLLLGKGVSTDDVDYYSFKIGKLVTDSKSFEQAATEYFADHQPRGAVRVDLGGSLSGGGAPNTPNDMMNALIRRAGK